MSVHAAAGDLLKASVSVHAFSISIARPSGQIVELNGSIPDIASTSAPARLIIPCEIAISGSLNRAALAIPTASGVFLQLFDLSTGQLAQIIRVPPKFPIQFSLHPVGFINNSVQLAVSQAHYLPSGEPEVPTQLVDADGSITPAARSVLGPKYTEVSRSSFDFCGGRVLRPTVTWTDLNGSTRPMTRDDIRVVAPYNAQVADLSSRLPVRVGTVDRFQGQEAAVVIYSLKSSSPEDAPRGMEFLHSRNRLNVALSQARAIAVVVGSVKLFEPDCNTPRQMHLANALCRDSEKLRRGSSPKQRTDDLNIER